jgi:hypothetical protein
MTNPSVAKALLKVGLKAFAPLLSDVVAKALEEGGTLLIDDRAAAEAKRITERLVERIEEGVAELSRSEGMTADSSAWVAPTLLDVLQGQPLISDDWVAANFDPGSIAEKILAGAPTQLQTLSLAEREFFAKILKMYFVLFAKERDVIDGLESQFRSSVMKRLTALPSAVAAQIANEATAQRDVAIAALLSVQKRRWRPEISSPGALLRADIENPVRFHGRTDDLASLDEWCDRRDSLLLRLYTGAGGMGKSRLLLEACDRRLRRGWRAGFLDSRSGSLPLELLGALFAAKDTLVVVDYAETRRSELEALLNGAFAAKGAGRIRVVLLARSAGDWWDAMAAAGGGAGELVAGPAAAWTPLRPLTAGRGDREASYQIASNHFAQTLGQTRQTAVPDDLDNDIYETALILHMRALCEIEGVPVKGDQGILDYILDRERRYWRNRARDMGVPELLAACIAQAVALITLRGGASTSEDAIRALRELPRLGDQPIAALAALSELLHSLYPGDLWIEPLLPDLLGEHLVQKEMERDSDELLNAAFGEKSRD